MNGNGNQSTESAVGVALAPCYNSQVGVQGLNLPYKWGSCNITCILRSYHQVVKLFLYYHTHLLCICHTFFLQFNR